MYEYTRECLALKVARRINSFGVIEALADAMLAKRAPEHVRCDNGPEIVPGLYRSRLARLSTKTCAPSRAARGRTGTVRASTGSSV